MLLLGKEWLWGLDWSGLGLFLRNDDDDEMLKLEKFSVQVVNSTTMRSLLGVNEQGCLWGSFKLYDMTLMCLLPSVLAVETLEHQLLWFPGLPYSRIFDHLAKDPVLVCL